METQQSGVKPRNEPVSRLLARRADTYGLVFLLIIVDYIAVSTLLNNTWGNVVIVALLGSTLLFTLRTSKARPVWQLLALFYLLAGMLSTIASARFSSAAALSQWATITGGLLLIVTPFVILRRIGAHRVVTTETVLGAICVYLLIGFSFAFIYSAVSFLSGMPFFEGQQSVPFNSYLFFSYTTLTTVGYGNLVPVGNLGQTLAMLEALSGQVYLVIIVARLVSLWGQSLPRSTRRLRGGATAAGKEEEDIGSAKEPDGDAFDDQDPG